MVPDTYGSTAAKHRLTAGRLPRPAHVVIVIEENKAYSDIFGNPRAAYLNKLARIGAWFEHAYGETHPSQPNYLALFSGTTHDLWSDRCPLDYTGPNLASALEHAGLGPVAGSYDAAPAAIFVQDKAQRA